jgi:hypothetical protein
MRWVIVTGNGQLALTIYPVGKWQARQGAHLDAELLALELGVEGEGVPGLHVSPLGALVEHLPRTSLFKPPARTGLLP